MKLVELAKIFTTKTRDEIKATRRKYLLSNNFDKLIKKYLIEDTMFVTQYMQKSKSRLKEEDSQATSLFKVRLQLKLKEN